MRLLARVLAFLSLAASTLFFFRVNSLAGVVLAIPKLVLPSLAPFVAATGAAGAALGLLSKSAAASIAGALGSCLALRYIRRATAPHQGFEAAFGPNWMDRIPPERAARMLPRRWSWRWTAGPAAPAERDIPFWQIPGCERALLCDVWRPPQGVEPTGVAVVYLHGGGWHWLDKDFGTRPLFGHLAAQGHVVMDVAYRLCPEADIRGMVGDAKRAIAWMKQNAGRYGVDPERIVLVGGSAGAQIALLAAYAPCHPELTPDDVEGLDVSVCGVASYYGPADMRAVYGHTALALLARNEKRGSLARGTRCSSGATGIVRAERATRGRFAITRAEMMANLLGGEPDGAGAMYELASPLAHAGPHCPPTLLFHGEHDFMVPVSSTRALYRKLVDAGVPAVYVEFPQTDHAFDLASMSVRLGTLAQASPPAQAAAYDLDRFLALMAAGPPGRECRGAKQSPRLGSLV